MKKQLCVGAMLLIILGIAGCSDEDREFTQHEPGVYKGAQDPLLAQQQHQELNNRFMKVQTDR